jgi:hypothetical protein
MPAFVAEQRVASSAAQPIMLFFIIAFPLFCVLIRLHYKRGVKCSASLNLKKYEFPRIKECFTV